MATLQGHAVQSSKLKQNTMGLLTVFDWIGSTLWRIIYCSVYVPWINERDSEEMILKVRLCISVFQDLIDGCLGRLYGWTVFISWYHCAITFFRGRIIDTEEFVSGLKSGVIVIKGLRRWIISSTSFSSLSDNISPWHSSSHSCPLRKSRWQAAPDTA